MYLISCFYHRPLSEDFLKKLNEEDTQIESSLPSYLATVYGFHGNASHDTDHSPLLFNSPSCMSQAVAKQPEYAPPPGCRSLADCNVIGQLVSVIAIITQGKGRGLGDCLVSFFFLDHTIS